MIRTLIIEDEVNARKGLKKMLALTHLDIEIIGETSSIKETKAFLRDNTIDLAFVDVILDDGNSFKIFEHLKEFKFKIIFTTAYNQYAVKAFKFNALDYLLKPIDPEELLAAVNKAITVLDSEHQFRELLSLTDEKNNQKITLKTTEDTHIVPVTEILRLEAEGAYTKFITESKSILVSKNLRFYEDLLEEYDFIRIHQSHLVNFKHVKRLNALNVEMSNNELVPVSTRKRQLISNKIKQLRV